jgi:hypothetical protein
MRKIFSLALILIASLSIVSAADLDPITQAKALLDQYSSRVRSLEAENSILREEMRKAKIQIPLSLFSWAIQTGTSSTIPDISTSIVVITWSVTPVVSTTPAVPPVTGSGEVSFANIEKTHGSSFVGFIHRIITEWDKVRDAYAMPKGARIGGYELVQSGALDHVFVDIVYTGSISGTGIYDAKILYQFNKTTYARKLIGFFEYNVSTGYYTTKTGKNIFSGVKRTWVADPRIASTFIAATAVSTWNTTPPPMGTTSASIADIETAYTTKRYLTTISLSNAWLLANTPTLEVLRVRYRTYFIIAKYSEALAEIGRIQSIGQLTSAVACEGAIIAGPKFGNNSTLATSYQAICNKK